MQDINNAEQLLLLKQDFDNFKQQVSTMLAKKDAQIQELDNRVKEMELSKQKTEYQYEQIMDSLKLLNEQTIPNLAAQIQELKNRPAKRYDQAITGILGAIFGAVGSLIATKLFK